MPAHEGPVLRGAELETIVELGGAEYMVRSSGYLKTLDDFRAIPLAAAKRL